MQGSGVPSATGQNKRAVVIDGEKFEVGCLTMKAVGKLQNWIDNLEKPNFVEKARAMAEGIDPEIAKNLMTVAQAQEYNWPPNILSAPEDAFRALMTREDGWNLFLFTALSTARPDLSAAAIESIAGKTDTEQFEQIWMAALGVARPDVVVHEARSRMCLFTEDAIHDFTRGVFAMMGLDFDAVKLDSVLRDMPIAAYGSVMNLTIVKGEPVVPKAEVGPRKGDRKSTSRSSTPTSPIEQGGATP